VGGVNVELHGRVAVAGEGRGLAIVTDEPLSLWGGLDPTNGEIIDRHHPLCGQIVTGRVLVLPHGRGSCSASGVLLEAIRNGTGPAAILTARVDPIISLGSILADELYDRPVPVVVLPDSVVGRIETGALVAVTRDGRILVERAGASPTR
jgi:predicted aconitase with swiveling domain